jgi:hypothetical protein
MEENRGKKFVENTKQGVGKQVVGVAESFLR